MSSPIMDKNKLVAMLREASHVERCHVIRHHGSYTVGQHSFDMMTLAWALCPLVTRNLMMAIMFHDLPERWTGDMPGVMKDTDAELAKRMARLEARIENRLGWRIELTDDERYWLKGLDVLEFYLWCCDESHLGNVNVSSIIPRVATWFSTNQVPVQIADFIMEYKWQRSPDTLPK